MNKKVLVGLSWCYANGRLHIGHIGSSLPADVVARYHRIAGDDVSFITGSDCYGTPIMVSAKNEGVNPEDIAQKYHQLLHKDFLSLGFSFDNFSKTMGKYHRKFVRDFHEKMYETDNVFAKSSAQLYCEYCRQYLPDRYVEGECPFCGSHAKGDSCDNCGKMLEPEELKNPKCKLCGATPKAKNTRQIYLRLTKLLPEINANFESKKEAWTVNAQGMTKRYIDEGLIDRAITRNIEWGIELPENAQSVNSVDPAGTKYEDSFDDKRIYIWAENVLGYFSATKEFCETTGGDWQEFLLDTTPTEKKHYYVHAKDNIPFHTVILPGLLLAEETQRWHLPDQIIASEYVSIEGKKVSKSAGTMLTVEELAAAFPADMIRYYFLKNVNAHKDVNFTFLDFVQTINGELINNFANLVNRTLAFAVSKFGGKIDKARVPAEIKKQIETTRAEVSALIEGGEVNKALAEIMKLVSFSNKYFDECAPWISVKNDEKKCRSDIFAITTIIANVVRMLEPFLPDTARRVQSWLGVQNNDLEPFYFAKSFNISNIAVLFNRLDIKEVSDRFAGYIK
ncbi:MAG: methionine--tRNA ligase [Christensenellaceae bacterium]|jgi:methionyl-tRNA synthetase|nr:methionine--tRNA ligase [Christensenellaceae bacterium]